MIALKKGSLGYRFALAASALAAFTLFLTIFAAIWLVNQQQNKANKTLLQKEASYNARLLNSTLNAITTRLSEAANSSLLANALIDSAGRQTYLIPYLNGMQTINGVRVKLLFADFEGKEIASSGDTHFSEPQLAWLRKQLANGQAEVGIFPSEHGDELLVSELMVYSRTQSPEGALMYKIALSDLQTLISAKLIWGDAKPPENSWQVPLEVAPRLRQLQIRVAQLRLPDNDSVHANSAYLLILLLACVLASLVFFVGLRLAPGLTRDLRELEEFSRSVVENGFAGQRANVHGSREVVGLANSINRMLDRLHEQHAKLQAESEARYRLLVEGTKAVSWEATLPAFQYQYVSPQGQAITQIEATQWLQAGFWRAHLHPDDSYAVLLKREQAVREQRDYQVEYRFLRADGSYVWLEEIAAILADENGQAQSARGILLNIDERKLAEARLLEERSKVDRLKNEFVSTVSHELRTPLTSIRGSLGLVLGGVVGELSPQAKKLISIAQQNSENLVRLINDLLDIDKIVSGKMEFEWQWLELLPVVEQAIENNQAYAANLGIKLVLLQTVPQAMVKVDVTRIHQVLANLLSNAAKFSPTGSQVEVRMEKHVGQVRVLVQDHGPGISVEFRDKIFQKFSQQDASSTRAKGGTGLGLAISKVLIEQMGGQIGFDSEPGLGARFYFDLPL